MYALVTAALALSFAPVRSGAGNIAAAVDDAACLVQRSASHLGRAHQTWIPDSPSLFNKTGISRTEEAAVSVERPVTVALNDPCGDGGFQAGEYIYAGRTQTGAPYYKSTQAGHPIYDALYLYFDPSCKGDADFNPSRSNGKWILDNDEPDLMRLSDLDSDGTCAFWGRLRSDDSTRPPMGTNTWRLHCDATWKNISVTLKVAAPEERKVPAPADAAPVLNVAATNTEASLAFTKRHPGLGNVSQPAAAAGAPAALKVSVDSSCAGGQWQAGAYSLAGTTLGGAPYYKSTDAGSARFPALYLYWDASCNGRSSPARWVIDNDEPNTTLFRDLDSDGQCAFWARQYSENRTMPPLGRTTWRLACDGKTWQDVAVTLTRVNASSAPQAPAPPIAAAPNRTTLPMLSVAMSGPCSEWQQGDYYFSGRTRDGAPYYRSTVAGRLSHAERYMYYDISVGWVVDSNPPNTKSASAIDNGRTSTVWAQQNWKDDARPQMGTSTWMVLCNHSWKSASLTLAATHYVATTTLTLTETTTTDTTTSVTTMTETTMTTTTSTRFIKKAPRRQAARQALRQARVSRGPAARQEGAGEAAFAAAPRRKRRALARRTSGDAAPEAPRRAAQGANEKDVSGAGVRQL